jgi:hypothetical protein
MSSVEERFRLTTASGVESGDLSEVGVVLDCMNGQLDYYCSGIAVVFDPDDVRPQIEVVWYRGVNVRFARKNSPEMLRASQRTITIF